MNLLYIADPMCSWCYGFGNALDALLAEHAAGLHLLTNGYLPLEALHERLTAPTGQAPAPPQSTQ